MLPGQGGPEREPAGADRRCQGCGASLPGEATICGACGAAHGEANRCPHCRAVADVAAHRELGFRCLVCGGVRLPLGRTGIAAGAEADEALVRAGRAQAQRLTFGAVAMMLGLAALLALVVVTASVVATEPGTLAVAAAYGAAAVPLLLAVHAARRGARAGRDAARERIRARTAAVVELVRSGHTDVPFVARALGVDESRAALLLGEATVTTLLEAAPAARVASAPVTSDHPFASDARRVGRSID